MEMVVGGRDGKVVCYSGGINSPVDVPEVNLLNQKLIASCYPNPVNISSGQTAKIKYATQEDAHIIVQIYNTRGELVKTAFDGIKQKGLHYVEWDGIGENLTALSAGLYYCRVSDGKSSVSLKIVIL